jgi:hypothetical protein
MESWMKEGNKKEACSFKLVSAVLWKYTQRVVKDTNSEQILNFISQKSLFFRLECRGAGS